MKGDMRFTLPLWQMGSIVILMVFTVVIGISAEFIFTTSDDGFEFEMNLDNWGGAIFSATLLVLALYMTVMLLKVGKHNKQFPDKKIRSFSLKPSEYIEDDEFFEEMTKRATKKVYSYYTVALPLLVGVSIGGFWGRTAILVGILAIAFGQYWIYYSTMRKMFKDEGGEE